MSPDGGVYGTVHKKSSCEESLQIPVGDVYLSFVAEPLYLRALVQGMISYCRHHQLGRRSILRLLSNVYRGRLQSLLFRDAQSLSIR